MVRDHHRRRLVDRVVFLEERALMKLAFVFLLSFLAMVVWGLVVSFLTMGCINFCECMNEDDD